MSLLPAADAPLLVMDTCGELASLAFFRGARLLEERVLPERTASVTLLRNVRELLDAQHTGLTELCAVGVVSGPGSFTGLRVGLALAKGLCEASGIPLAAVSRLAVLAEAAGKASRFSVLGAGRDHVYVREGSFEEQGHEWLATLDSLAATIAGNGVAVADAELGVRLTTAADVLLVRLAARHAAGAVQRSLARGGSDSALIDASYVRTEEAIYARQQIAT